MKKKTTKSNLWIKVSLLLATGFINFSSLSAQVLLDSHSAGNGSPTWTITTSHANELIVISAGGYGSPAGLTITPGTVTVNGNNATYETRGIWAGPSFSWQETIWAYAAAIPGTYTCVCTESGLLTPYYFNYACSVYQPNCPQGLSTGNVVIGGNNDNQNQTSISAVITTTLNNSWVYGSVDNNDNPGSGTIAWSGKLTELDHNYLGFGVDGAQADSTYALAGTYTITSTDMGATNWMTIALIAVQPNQGCCTLTASANTVTNVRCNGNSTGSATATPGLGHTPYTYSWSPGGKTTATVTGLTAGAYTVTITDATGCTATAPITITQPTVLTASATSTNVLCNGGTGTVSGSATGGTSPYTYLWAPVGATNATVTGLSAGCYTLAVGDANACTATATVCITQPTPLTVTVSGPQNICIGDTGTLVSTSSGGTSPYNYTWAPSIPSTNSTATIIGATQTDTVKITDANGCTASAKISITGVPYPVAVIKPASDSVCLGDSALLTASGGKTYIWSNGKTTSTIKVAPQSATTYTLFASNGLCSDSTTITVKIIPRISAVSSIVDSIVCPHDSSYLSITVSGGPATYKWNTGATTSAIRVSDTITTIYTGTAYGICDSVVKTFTVTVIPLPKPIINGDTIVCNGTNDTLTVSSLNGPTKYLWSNGKTTTSIIIGNISADSTLYVKAYNSLGCEVTDTFHITDRLYPTANLTYTGGCGNTETTITATPSGTGPFTYQWNTGSTNDTITVGFINDTATSTVVISNGCPITKTITVLQDVPMLSACCNTTIFSGEDTILVASGPNMVKYRWYPDDGSLNCDTCQVVIATPKVTTTYTVIGTDTGGCPIERTIIIIVDIPCSDFSVPNVFTPTNPGLLGLDNIFYIQTKNIDAWSLTIYDRWGKTVYQSTNPNQYWDGNTKGGSKSLEGVYYYAISATCEGGKTYQKNGFVQLIR